MSFHGIYIPALWLHVARALVRTLRLLVFAVEVRAIGQILNFYIVPGGTNCVAKGLIRKWCHM
jgi:hypothetical protein